MLIPFTVKELSDTLIPESAIRQIVNHDGKVEIFFHGGRPLLTKNSYEEFKKRFKSLIAQGRFR